MVCVTTATGLRRDWEDNTKEQLMTLSDMFDDMDALVNDMNELIERTRSN